MKKTVPLFLLAGLILGCSEEKEIQMNMTDVQLVKIDTVQRYPDIPQQILTWRTDDHINYVTFEPLGRYYTVGYRMKVMVKR